MKILVLVLIYGSYVQQASQGKVKEEELVDRLMGIVGHLVLRKTLKVLIWHSFRFYHRAI